jgi:hypothetical protein
MITLLFLVCLDLFCRPKCAFFIYQNIFTMVYTLFCCLQFLRPAVEQTMDLVMPRIAPGDSAFATDLVMPLPGRFSLC